MYTKAQTENITNFRRQYGSMLCS